VFDPVVITVGSFHAGTADNIIPDEAHFLATVRSFSGTARDRVRAASLRLIGDLAAAHGLRAEAEYLDRHGERAPSVRGPGVTARCSARTSHPGQPLRRRGLRRASRGAGKILMREAGPSSGPAPPLTARDAVDDAVLPAVRPLPDASPRVVARGPWALPASRPGARRRALPPRPRASAPRATAAHPRRQAALAPRFLLFPAPACRPQLGCRWDDAGHDHETARNIGCEAMGSVRGGVEPRRRPPPRTASAACSRRRFGKGPAGTERTPLRSTSFR
jgi:hypothetical protein